MASTLRALRLQKCKWGIERSFVEPHPKFEIQFTLINQFLATPNLGRKSIMWGAKMVAKLRDFPNWLEDREKQKEIDYLDERVSAARERLAQREAKKIPIPGRKPGRPRKGDLVPPPAPPSGEDIESKLRRLMGEKP